MGFVAVPAETSLVCRQQIFDKRVFFLAAADPAHRFAAPLLCCVALEFMDTAPRRVEQKEKTDLLEELMLLPENAVVRRINELVKRARSVKVHAYIIHYLRKQMPYMMGKQEKQVRSPCPLPRALLPSPLFEAWHRPTLSGREAHPHLNFGSPRARGVSAAFRRLFGRLLGGPA